MLRFVLAFAVLASAFYAMTLLWPFYREHLFPACLRLTARTSGAVLTALGQDIAVEDTSISTPDFSAQIVRGCDAVEPVGLFICAVLAFPAPFMRRICGLIAGTLTLAILNCVRIVSLFLIAVYVPGLLHVMHVDVWQGMFIVLTLVLWFLWLLWATQSPTPAKPTSG